MHDKAEPLLQVDPSRFRHALGSFATGVAVVTTLAADGKKSGITINSFNSVSLEPPLLLWSVANNARSCDTFVQARYFAVQVLSSQQQSLARLFASKDDDKFSGMLCSEGIGGVPLLRDYAACFECETEHVYAGGDHKIIVGRVLKLDDNETDPLVFYRGHFIDDVKPKA